MKKDYNLYVWEDALSDWTEGIIFAYATSVEEARKIIKETGNKKAAKYGDGYSLKDFLSEEKLNAEPKIIKTKTAYLIFGSGC